MSSPESTPDGAPRLSVALVHDNFTGPTGMGWVTENHARWALEAGCSVTVVGDNVPQWLACQARVIRARRPRWLASLPEHLVWCERAKRGLRLVDADVVHVHSPRLAGRADVLTAHHLAQPAHDRGVREVGAGMKGALRIAQRLVTRRLDDRAYHRIRGRGSPVSFVSEFLRDEFASHYGEPAGGWILSPPSPPWQPVTDAERAAARETFAVRPAAVTVGYAGGNDPRKGYFHLAQLEREDGIELLTAGLGSEALRLHGRQGLGFVDLDEFYAACDVVVAPTGFDAAPVAVLQAIARGVPVVLTPTCGWASAVRRHHAGVVWSVDEPLADAVLAAARCPAAGCEALTAEFSPERQRERLIAVYRELAGRAGRG